MEHPEAGEYQRAGESDKRRHFPVRALIVFLGLRSNREREQESEDLTRRKDDQPRPAGEEAKPGNGRDRSKPAHIRQRHQVETPAEQGDADHEQVKRAAVSGSA